jgi:hypothetical protein
MWIALLAGMALAHDPGLSYAELRAGELSLVFAASDGVQDPAVRVQTPEGPCTLGPWTSAPFEEDAVSWRASLDCGEGPRTYHADFLSGAAPGHRHVVQGEGPPLVLDAGLPSGTVMATAGPASVALSFLVMGIEHVLLGFDHLAFLLALLLVARTWQQVGAVITTFTVAHSVTLISAAAGWVSAPGWLVEPVIAASIVYAGIDNLLHPERPHRLWLIFGLGLVHGLGFAGALGELGLPAGHALIGLLSFNGGVEIGQLMVAVVAVPVIAWAARQPRWERVGLPACSVAVAGLGAWWLVERVVG